MFLTGSGAFSPVNRPFKAESGLLRLRAQNLTGADYVFNLCETDPTLQSVLSMDARPLTCTHALAAPPALPTSRVLLQSRIRSPIQLRGSFIPSLNYSRQIIKVRRRKASRSAAPFVSVPVAAMETLPNNFGFVLLTVVGTAGLTLWQSIMVSRQRAKSGIPYPKMYEDAEPSVFNCYQRAHQNTLENYPAVLGCLLAGGLKYPITASAFGTLWVAGRIVYSLGYFTGDPAKRLRGVWHYFGQWGVMITAVVAAVNLLSN